MGYLVNNLKLSGVYVTLNNPCGEVDDSLKKKKIDTKTILFIDGASGKENGRSGNCISLKGNKSLTELSLTISAACKNKMIRYVFFDSLSTLLVYHDLETAQRFIHYFINKIKNLNLLMVLISVDDEKSNKLLSTVSQLCDETISI